MAAECEGLLTDLEAASKYIPANVPYVMMNMVKFRPVAQYPAEFHFQNHDPRPLSGSEAYKIYREAFAKRAAALGVKSPDVLFLGRAHTNLIMGQHEGEAWDLILLVRFESFASFRSVLEDDVYITAIQPHRLAAVQDFKSLAVTEVGL
jgi:hypothetical protein